MDLRDKVWTVSICSSCLLEQARQAECTVLRSKDNGDMGSPNTPCSVAHRPSELAVQRLHGEETTEEKQASAWMSSEATLPKKHFAGLLGDSYARVEEPLRSNSRVCSLSPASTALTPGLEL